MIKASITAFYALSLSEFHMHPHSHESCEIMYVTGGSCTVYCKDESYRIGPNHFIFIHSNIPHRLDISLEKPCSILNLEFDLSETDGDIPLNGLLEESSEFKEFWNKAPDCFCGADLRDLGYSLKDLISHIQRFAADDDFLLQLIVSRTMVELSYSIVSRGNNSGVCYLRSACDYIDDNFHSEIKVSEVAEHIGISRSYPQSLFSSCLGCGIAEYVTRKRMEEAVFLLVNSSMKITDIAFAVGYNSRQHFAHTFEKYHGCGPLAYRQTHKKVLAPDTGKSRYIIIDGKKIAYRNLGN